MPSTSPRARFDSRLALGFDLDRPPHRRPGTPRGSAEACRQRSPATQSAVPPRSAVRCAAWKGNSSSRAVSLAYGALHPITCHAEISSIGPSVPPSTEVGDHHPRYGVPPPASLGAELEHQGLRAMRVAFSGYGSRRAPAVVAFAGRETPAVPSVPGPRVIKADMPTRPDPWRCRRLRLCWPD